MVKKIGDYLIKDGDRAKIILSYVLDKNSTYITTNFDQDLDIESVKQIDDIYQKLDQGQPLQYAIGRWDFFGRDFLVDPSVLIPRPETEILVDLILKEDLENKRILDIGTGSGAIAISLALESSAQVTASDISIEALQTAKTNAKRLGAQVKFIESDLFENIDDKFDIIVSNPPYISEEEYKTLDKDLFYEPKTALVGGEIGSEIYEKIVKQLRNYLNEGGQIYFEIGYDQKEPVSKRLEDFGFSQVECIKDYNGFDRIIRAKLENMV